MQRLMSCYIMAYDEYGKITRHFLQQPMFTLDDVMTTIAPTRNKESIPYSKLFCLFAF